MTSIGHHRHLTLRPVQGPDSVIIAYRRGILYANELQEQVAESIADVDGRLAQQSW